ncbi:TnsD family transposase [Tumebacillus sp. ITR2]|uniref:TnsD family transposase n=1 Tax=Tumebacillus amylolyticus TaxID=2801339 RepID=A0ABS1J5J9_9BACL|nr:TnsD family Tn7-like transposition protein [Tumebacillus amylolyticus]MBL0385553.1 TnsD family transposase [Tumebacillus amylolyticus]
MLGFFPQLYPDELLYSWFARYHLYCNNASPKQTMIDLYGDEKQLAVPDLPTNLEEINGRVRHFIKQTADDWISQHTFFRFYTSFALPEFRARAQETMRTNARDSSLHMLTGVMASTFKDKKYFEYCAICAEEDLKTHGEMYWHLPHQLPGVLVCTKHGVPLRKSLAPFRPDNRHHYVAATRETCPSLAPIISYDPKTMEHLQEISLEAERLVQRDYTFDREAIRQTYLVLLQKQELARGKSHVYQRKLAEQFRAFYGDECLRILQSEVSMEGENSWLRAITRKHRRAFHPIRHLLLIRFLGETLESISSQIHTPYNPFGDSPYPCLNHAADHFRESIVSDLKITRCTDTGKPVGTFTCNCGFQYSRRGPDLIETDRFRIGRIKEFGPVWQSRLEKLIHVEKLSYRAAARMLGVDPNTVIKYSKQSIPSVMVEPSKPCDLLEIKQKQWVDLRTRYPHAGTTQLRKEDNALYSWLYRNCRDWLAANSPMPTDSNQSKARIDWGARDLRLSKQIHKAAQQLRQETPPIRITLHGIARRVRSKALIEQHLDKLPETKKALTKLSESKDAFHVRRIHWAVQKIREAGEELVEWLILRVAAIRQPLSLAVEQEIHNAMIDPAFAERSAL